MAGSVLYLCETGGARILAYGAGSSQVGTNHQLSVKTWDALPQGESGTNLFRSIDVAVLAGGAYQLGITPTVDGVDQAEQLFSGSGAGQGLCQAMLGLRGTRLSATVRTVTRNGDLELENIGYVFVPIRTFP